MKRALWFLFFLMFLSSNQIFGLIPDRRESKGDEEFGWVVAPTPMIISGIGAAVPVLGMLSNAYKTTDLMGMKTLPGGDFDMQLLIVDQLPLFTEHVLLQAGTMQGLLPVKSYRRGIDSDKDDFTQPLLEQSGTIGNLRLLFYEQRIRLFYNQFSFISATKKVFDSEGNEFKNVDTSDVTYNQHEFGTILDFTDNRTDPRKGVRFGFRRNFPENNEKMLSDTYVTDFNLSFFIPIFENDTLVFNFYRSDATVTREGLVDETVLRQLMSLGCQYSSEYDACVAAETKRINEQISANTYGTASSLGGANRLQAYDQGRFKAGHATYRGVEYRFNFSTAETPINWYLLGGLKTIFQLAFFAEQGTVNDHTDQLNSNFKSSYGIGLRTIISGIVYRFDLAMGDEGIKPTIFFFYPMDLEPVGG